MIATWDLRFEGEDVTSFHSLDDTGSVVYTGSFSKIVAPGMRMGYLVAPNQVMERAMSFKSPSGANEFAALTIEQYLKKDMYQHIDDQNDSLRVKRDAMLASLGENFGDAATWSHPGGWTIRLADDARRSRPCRVARPGIQRGGWVL